MAFIIYTSASTYTYHKGHGKRKKNVSSHTYGLFIYKIQIWVNETFIASQWTEHKCYTKAGPIPIRNGARGKRFLTQWWCRHEAKPKDLLSGKTLPNHSVLANTSVRSSQWRLFGPQAPDTVSGRLSDDIRGHSRWYQSRWYYQVVAMTSAKGSNEIKT